ESIVEAQQRTWPEFVRLVRSTGPLGINHTDLVPSPLSLGAHNTIAAFAYVLALAAGNPESGSFLDWGGGPGHYRGPSRAPPPAPRVEYFCRAPPLLGAAGGRVLRDAPFFEQAADCAGRTYALAVASSSLHSSEDWQTTLRLLAGLAGRYLFVTRLPVVQ